MAYYSKEIYRGKKAWAENHALQQMPVAIRNGMASQQAAAMMRLSKDRHFIHVNSDALFRTSSRESDRIYILVHHEIHDYLEQVGLQNDLIMDTSNLDDDKSFCIGKKYKDAEEYAEAYCNARDRNIAEIEKFNLRIEKFMRKIDEQYGTSYSPSRMKRLYTIVDAELCGR